MRLTEILSWQTTSGEKVSIGDIALTPQSRALIIRRPRGGWVWNRPGGIVVEREGQTERIPIVDTTRRVQFALLGLSLALLVFGFARNRRRG